jgi:hypothetical protein
MFVCNSHIVDHPLSLPKWQQLRHDVEAFASQFSMPGLNPADLKY